MRTEPCITRRDAVALLAAAAGVGLSGCSNLPIPLGDSTRPRTISSQFTAAVFYYDYGDSYISSVREALGAGLSAAGVTYHEYDAANNQTTQDTQISQAIQDGASVLVVNIVTAGNAEVADVICRRAVSAKIPVVFFNRPVEGEGDEGAILDYYDDVAFVGTDPAQAGHLQGQMIGTYLAQHFDECDINRDGAITYVQFKGQASNPEAIYRTRYSVDDANKILVANGRPELVYFEPDSVDTFQLDLTGSWSASSAQNYMENDLDHYTEKKGQMIELVIANSDAMAAGAIRALQNHGYNTGEKASRTIPVFGVDATESGKQLIAEGAMTGTVAQDARGMADCVTAMVINARGGRDLLVGMDDYARDTEHRLDRKIYIPYSIYNPDAESPES